MSVSVHEKRGERTRPFASVPSKLAGSMRGLGARPELAVVPAGGRILFTSDLHFGHEKVAALRGFDSVGWHDHEVYKSISDAVTGRQDILWILGDLADRESDWERALSMIGSLPCRKRLVLGNHDPAHPMHQWAERYAQKLSGVFEWWGTLGQTRVVGKRVMVSHFPYHRDREGTAPRYLSWRPRDEGLWLLHGHTHGNEKGTPESREVHVGWDAWRRPVMDHEISAIMDSALSVQREA